MSVFVRLTYSCVSDAASADNTALSIYNKDPGQYTNS